MNPIFTAQSAIEHKLMAKILYGWFVDNRAHGTDWSQST